MANPPMAGSRHSPPVFEESFYPPSIDTNQRRLDYLDEHLSLCSAERSRLLSLLLLASPPLLPPVLAGSEAIAASNEEKLQSAPPPLSAPAASEERQHRRSSIASSTAVVRPAFRTIFFDGDDTFGRVLLGARFRASLELYNVLLSFWFVGILVGWFALWHLIPVRFTWFALLMAPHIVYDFLIFKRPLIRSVLLQQQTIVYNFWCFVFLAAMLLENRNQQSYAGVVLLLVFTVTTALVIPLFDTLPLHIRAIATKLGAPAAVPFLVMIQASLYFNWSQNPSFVISALGHLAYTTSSIASSSLNNIIILTAINSLYGFLYPSSLVMIRSRTETFQVSREDARVLREVDEVSLRRAAENKEEDFITMAWRRAGRSMQARSRSSFGGGSTIAVAA